MIIETCRLNDQLYQVPAERTGGVAR
jgi:hypothetical protein